MDDLEVLGRAVHAVDWTHATILFSEDAGQNNISILSFSRIFVLFFFFLMSSLTRSHVTSLTEQYPCVRLQDFQVVE